MQGLLKSVRRRILNALDHGHPLGDNLVLCTSMRFAHACKGFALDCNPSGYHGHPLGNNFVLLLFLLRKNNNKHVFLCFLRPMLLVALTFGFNKRVLQGA